MKKLGMKTKETVSKKPSATAYFKDEGNKIYEICKEYFQDKYDIDSEYVNVKCIEAVAFFLKRKEFDEAIKVYQKLFPLDFKDLIWDSQGLLLPRLMQQLNVFKNNSKKT